MFDHVPDPIDSPLMFGLWFAAWLVQLGFGLAVLALFAFCIFIAYDEVRAFLSWWAADRRRARRARTDNPTTPTSHHGTLLS